MEAGFKLFGEGGVDGALAGYAAEAGESCRCDFHIEMRFAAGPGTGMPVMTGAIVHNFKRGGRKLLS